MRQSKSLKPRKFRWQYEEEAKTFFKNLSYQFRRLLVWPLIDNYAMYKERIQRSFQYAHFGWLNHDFDMAFAYELLEFKLKRLYECLLNGHAKQEPQDMAALKELIKIVRRLRMDNYDNKYHDAHDKIWGKIKSKTTPNYDDKGKIINYSWNSSRSGTKDATEEVKKQERKEFMACYEKAEEDRVRDIDRMAEILKVHSPSFWD